jgi:hypothetical protein
VFLAIRLFYGLVVDEQLAEPSETVGSFGIKPPLTAGDVHILAGIYRTGQSRLLKHMDRVKSIVMQCWKNVYSYQYVKII